ncbi:MAG: hypothetical protein M3Q65_19930 [Chloroflexota bacterium]|nr:hypothetical protein [Chloroflexota bacterium]
MGTRLFPFVVPILVVATVITVVVGIGELLIFVNTPAAVWTALALTTAVGVIAAVWAWRASKLPPVEMPNPSPPQPVRQLDLGAGYLIGQFVLIFGAMLLLLFIIIAIMR